LQVGRQTPTAELSQYYSPFLQNDKIEPHEQFVSKDILQDPLQAPVSRGLEEQ
jgi:hypothetical protein